MARKSGALRQQTVANLHAWGVKASCLALCLTLSFAAHAAEAGAPPAGAVPTLDELRPAPATTKEGTAAVVPERPLARELGKPSDDVTLNVKAYAVADSAPQALREALSATA